MRSILSDEGPSGFTKIANRPRAPNVSILAAVPHDLVSVGYAEWFGFMVHEFLTCIDVKRAFTNGSNRAAQVLTQSKNRTSELDPFQSI